MSTGPLWLLVLCVGLLPSMTVAQGSTGTSQTNAEQSADQQASLEALQQELATRPDWTEGWWQLGTAAYDANRFDTAIPALQHVVRAAPQMGLAWNLLGLSQFGAKQYQDARTSLERAAVLANSNDAEVERVAAYHLALLRIRDGSFQSAAALLRSTFGAQPGAQASLALGLAVLHVPLLPDQVDPSHEALLVGVGDAAAKGADGVHSFADLAAANPDVPGLQLAYADALADAGRTQEAIRVVQRALATAPKGARGWKALAGWEQSEGQLPEARTAEAKFASLKEQEAAERTSSQLWFGLKAAAAGPEDRNEGMRAYAKGQYAAASRKLAGWARSHPDDGTAWAVLGLSEFHEHDDNDARVHLERGASLGLHGDAAAVGTARFTLGLLLLKDGEFDRASVELGAARRVLGDSPRMDTALGYVLLRRASIPGEGEDPLARDAGRIQEMLLESRYDTAFASFRDLLARYPHTHYLHYNFGNALMSLSEFDKASEQMQAERAITPDSALPYEGLASIALRQHRPSEAIENARHAAELMPNTAEPHYLLGRALLESGANTPEIIRELQRAASMDPNSPEVHYSLAKAYARNAEAAKAAEERAIFTRLSNVPDGGGNGQDPKTYSGPREAPILSGAANPQNAR